MASRARRSRRCARWRRRPTSGFSATSTATRVGARRLATLIRRAYTRGLGEPDGDENFAPQALCFLDAGGEERFEPYGHDLLRLHESRRRGRAAIAGGRLRAGPGAPGAARPRRDARGSGRPRPRGRADVRAAGARASPVDATLSVEFVANREARRLLAKRKVDADQIAREEAAGRARPLGRGGRAPRRRPRAGGGARRRRPAAAPAQRAAPLRRRARRGRAGGAGRAAARELRPGAAAPPRRRAAPALPGLAAGGHLPAARVQGAPAARSARGDGPARDQPCRIADRALHRPHPDRLAPPVQFDLAEACQQQPTADLPRWRAASGSGKTIFLQLVALAGVPAGLGADRGHRPQGRPPTRRACRASPSGSRRSSSRARSAIAACSTRCGSRAEETREDLTYSFLVSILPAPVSAGVADAAAPRRLRGDRRRCSQLHGGAAPVGRIRGCRRRRRRQGGRGPCLRPRPARPRRGRRRTARGRRRPGRLPADRAT